MAEKDKIMKKSGFKMKGFSGFGNSPMRVQLMLPDTGTVGGGGGGGTSDYSSWSEAEKEAAGYYKKGGGSTTTDRILYKIKNSSKIKLDDRG